MLNQTVVQKVFVSRHLERSGGFLECALHKEIPPNVGITAKKPKNSPLTFQPYNFSILQYHADTKMR